MCSARRLMHKILRARAILSLIRAGAVREHRCARESAGAASHGVRSPTVSGIQAPLRDAIRKPRIGGERGRTQVLAA